MSGPLTPPEKRTSPIVRMSPANSTGASKFGWKSASTVIAAPDGRVSLKPETMVSAHSNMNSTYAGESGPTSLFAVPADADAKKIGLPSPTAGFTPSAQFPEVENFPSPAAPVQTQTSASATVASKVFPLFENVQVLRPESPARRKSEMSAGSPPSAVRISYVPSAGLPSAILTKTGKESCRRSAPPTWAMLKDEGGVSKTHPPQKMRSPVSSRLLHARCP